MPTLITIAVTCWACVAVATPRRPLPGNEIQELVYVRLMGRQQWLMLLAFAATAVALFVLIGSLARPASAETIAVDEWAVYRVSDTYYSIARPGSMWVIVRNQMDGMIVVEDFVSGSPPVGASPINP